MGWVSYLEDMIECWTESFSRIECEAAASPLDVSGSARLMQTLLDHGRQMLTELKSHLELATDPGLDLAHECIDLRRRLEDAHCSLESFKAGMAKLQSDLAEREQSIRKLEQDNETLKARVQIHKEDYERAFLRSKQAGYEPYLTEERRKRHKPNK